jgi:CMP-N-acetylneuraminic acid synthetase
MYRNLKTIAFIPARKNSKGIKNKNLRLIGGKSLVEHAIIQALQSKVFDLIVLSTDSRQILSYAKKYDIVCSGIRPSTISTDKSKIIDAILFEHSILDFSDYDCLLLLQPTSPLRTVKDILSALELFWINGSQSVLSVCESDEKLHLLRKIDDLGRLSKISNVDSDLRRQDVNKIYRINGAIYINKIDDFFKKSFVFNENMIPYVMTDENSIDVDELEDLYLTRKTYRKFKRNNR